MKARLALIIAALALAVGPVQAQAPIETDSVAELLGRIEKRLEAGDESGFFALLSPAAVLQVSDFAQPLFHSETVRAVVRERNRWPLEGAAAVGGGFSLIVDVFTEAAARGRIVTARLDVAPSAAGSWQVVGGERLTDVQGLHRLRIDATSQFVARNLTVEAEDFLLTLDGGSVFAVESDDGVTGLVLLGRGEMRFSPAPLAERGQLRLFSGSDTLATQFDAVFVRVRPADYAAHVTGGSLEPAPVDPRRMRDAQAVLNEEAPKSYSLDLADLSPDVWFLTPTAGDFVAEVRTRRHGTLTYARTVGRQEDITLMRRKDERTIALYPSAGRLVSRGRSYSDDSITDYDIRDIRIDASILPERLFIQGRARLTLRVSTDGLATIALRLADSLTVSGVASVEQGHLPFLRLRGQDTVVIHLPRAVRRGAEVTLIVTYSGRLTPDEVESDVSGRVPLSGDAGAYWIVGPERNLLLSNQSLWYPHGMVSDYATATLRIVLPSNYRCVASGTRQPSADVALEDLDLPTAPADGSLFVFEATRPLRYLALVIGRFRRVAESDLALGVDAMPVALTVDTNSRGGRRGTEVLSQVEDILQFYAGLMGEVPYESLSIALVESNLPGGHSPAYAALLNDPVSDTPYTWRNDPATFAGNPEFFLAHELAHQWWGQAVGWKNYHEQWLSEGLSQYFAALYAQHVRGDDALVGVLRQFQRWSLRESSQGPVHLGSRLGHIKGDPEVFRALVYNKGAAVLHMLRRLVGDEAFFRGLRRFYTDYKFRKAGTDDLRTAFEAETDRPLDRFFERWIYGDQVPRLSYSIETRPGQVTVTFEQEGELLFDVPVTVTIEYAGGRIEDVVVPVTEQHVAQVIPVVGAVRNVKVDRDGAALAEFHER